jgi:hypothetical protein
MDQPDMEPPEWNTRNSPPTMTLVILVLDILVSPSPIPDPWFMDSDLRNLLVHKIFVHYMYISSDIDLTINLYSSSLSLMFHYVLFSAHLSEI